MKGRKRVLGIIILCLLCTSLHAQFNDFAYDDTVRSYALLEPSLGPPGPNGYPLVVGLHGAGSDGYGFILTANLILKSANERFIAVSPSSLKYPLLAWWNAGDGYEAITDSTDDVGFIMALIDTMVTNYNIDTTRIYLMGHSNGSMMAYRMAAEHSEKFAALAVNTGQMAYEYCNPEYPVPILHFHGLDDPICPFEGLPAGQVILPSVDSVMAIWRGINGCSTDPDTIYNDGRILGKRWPSANGKNDVVLYTIAGWEHKWPRTDEPGIDATNVMWDFLQLHTRGAETGITGKRRADPPSRFVLSHNFPNPFNPSTRISYTLTGSGTVSLKVYDLSGREVSVLVDAFHDAGTYHVSWQPEDLAGGVYFYRLKADGTSETGKMIYLK